MQAGGHLWSLGKAAAVGEIAGVNTGPTANAARVSDAGGWVRRSQPVPGATGECRWGEQQRKPQPRGTSASAGALRGAWRGTALPAGSGAGPAQQLRAANQVQSVSPCSERSGPPHATPTGGPRQQGCSAQLGPQRYEEPRAVKGSRTEKAGQETDGESYVRGNREFREPRA